MNMTPDRIYFDLIRCEDKSASLYLDLSIHFVDRIDLSWFWIELAMDEKQQAGLLQYCLDQKIFAPDLPDPAAIQNLEQQLNDLGLRASDPGLSVDGAFDIAIQVETSGMHDIGVKLTTSIQGPAYVQDKKLGLSEVRCLGKLRSGAERFAVSETLRSRLTGIR